MSLFRSEDMFLYKLVFSKDHEYPILNLLGQKGLVHFIDLNSNEQVFLLPYMAQVKRCEEATKKNDYII